MKIYCDIDGVLADFFGYLAKTMNDYVHLAEQFKNISIAESPEPFLSDLINVSYAAWDSIGYINFTNVHVSGNNSKITKEVHQFATTIIANNEYWWSHIPLLPDSFKLLHHIQFYDKTFNFLTRPFDEASKTGKINWIVDNFGFSKEETEKKIIFEKEKWHYAKPKTLLIDDSEENISLFQKHGGLTIHHKTVSETVTRLKKIFFPRVPSILF